jgi:hypothetical protein
MTVQKLVIFSIGALMLLPLSSCTQSNSAQLNSTTSTPAMAQAGFMPVTESIRQ